MLITCRNCKSVECEFSFIFKKTDNCQKKERRMTITTSIYVHICNHERKKKFHHIDSFSTGRIQYDKLERTHPTLLTSEFTNP